MASPSGTTGTALDLSADIVSLTTQVVNIRSVSHQEEPLADAIDAAVRPLSHLDVKRIGNTIVARTNRGSGERVVLAGHIDTVPENSNLPVQRTTREGEDVLVGLGTCDMKGGVAVMLRAASTVTQPTRDITYVFYDCEEVESHHNGLFRLSQSHPELLECDFAVLLEPTGAGIEAGCQGTLRAEIRLTGRRAHTARAWMGVNAIHAAAPILERLVSYEPRRVLVDGLEYREGLQAVGITGGVAGNVVPDACVVTVNHRFAPTVNAAQAEAHVREVFDGFDVRVTDLAVGALPGLDQPAARDFVAAVGAQPRPKFGWTDVARFTGLGIPAVNFGPGDPSYAHAPDEFVRISELESCERQLLHWLTH